MGIVNGSSTLASTNTTLIQTVSLACYWAEIDVEVLNPNGTDATVEIALSPNSASSPNPDDYIEKGGVCAANGGKIEHTNKKVIPGTKVFVKGPVGMVVQIRGKTVTKLNS